MVLPADRPLTYDDLLALPEDGLRHELIDGEHIVSPSPSYKHQRVLGNLYYVIRTFLSDRPLGEVLFAPFDVVFSPTNVAVPDLVYVSRERAAVLTERNAEGAPDLASSRRTAARFSRRRCSLVSRSSSRRFSL